MLFRHGNVVKMRSKNTKFISVEFYVDVCIEIKLCMWLSLPQNLNVYDLLILDYNPVLLTC